MTIKPLPDSGRLAGVLRTAELRQAGFTEENLRVLRERRVLVQLARGIYARADEHARVTAMPGGQRAVRAVVAVTPFGAQTAISHCDAAVIHGLETIKRDADKQGVISLTRPVLARGSMSTRPGIDLHVAALPPEHRTSWRGVQVTSVARTVVDLARSRTFGDAVVVADSALRRKLTNRSELGEVVAYCAGWPGIGQARRVVAFADGRAESVLESISRVAFDQGGLPKPDLQAWLGEDGSVIGRADFFWPEFGVIAEADGAAKYANPEEARKQLRRDAELRAAGFEVVHFGWNEIWLNPGQVVAAIQAAFARTTARRAAEALASAQVLRAS